MRIVYEHSEQYLRALAASIARDPASLEHWRCLHLAHTEGASYAWFEAVLNTLKDDHKDVDCDVVHCTDHDVLFIGRSWHVNEFCQVADELLREDPAAPSYKPVLYDLFHDWRTIRDLLLAKVGEPVCPVATVAPLIPLETLGGLDEVFAEAKARRKARLPLHVLLVEDDPLTRRLVAGSFKEQYALITAESAQEALAAYLLHAPDIVFLDIGLPDGSGFEVLRRILANDPEAYVVMFSGNSYLDNVTAALNAGALGFIAKPFKRDKMQHYIEDSVLHHHKCA